MKSVCIRQKIDLMPPRRPTLPRMDIAARIWHESSAVRRSSSHEHRGVQIKRKNKDHCAHFSGSNFRRVNHVGWMVNMVKILYSLEPEKGTQRLPHYPQHEKPFVPNRANDGDMVSDRIQNEIGDDKIH